MTVRSLWRLWALLMVAAALAWLILLPQPGHDVPPVAATRQGARLPTLAPLPRPADPAPTVARLAQSTLWGPVAPRAATGAAGAAAEAAPKWSVTGYYALSGIRHVVVSFDPPTTAALQLKVGDRLPDGSRIERIEPDRVRARAGSALAGDGAAAAGSVWLPVTPGLAAAPKDAR